jgi:hypothetical protein
MLDGTLTVDYDPGGCWRCSRWAEGVANTVMDPE